MSRTNIVIAALGSGGDLHPYLGLAVELQRRGYSVTIASSSCRRETVEQVGIAFQPMRPAWDDVEVIRRCRNMRKGPEIVLREFLLPELRGTYLDLLEIASKADLMISHETVFAAPLVAEKLGCPWASVVLYPSSFYSAHDPSVQAFAPELKFLRHAGLRVNRAFIDFGRKATKNWCEPIRRLRRELGLREDCDPIFADKHSPQLVLAIFSKWFAQAQKDWPSQTIQTGFVFGNGAFSRARGIAELEAFLAAGEAPIVFTLGTLAVHNQDNFAEISARAAEILGRRAILVLGPNVSRSPSRDLLILQYVSFADLFPRAAAIVHHGGIGTTAEALRAGKPTVVVPFGWDQPDNAERVQRAGVGLHLPRKRYTPATAAAALKSIINDSTFSMRAGEIASRVHAEDGGKVACDALERLLKNYPSNLSENSNQLRSAS